MTAAVEAARAIIAWLARNPDAALTPAEVALLAQVAEAMLRREPKG